MKDWDCSPEVENRCLVLEKKLTRLEKVKEELQREYRSYTGVRFRPDLIIKKTERKLDKIFEEMSWDKAKEKIK